MNIIAIIGNLTKDPELKATQSGASLLNVRLAVNERVKQGDRWTDRANYFDVVVFGKRGESLAGLLSKGSRIGVKGRLRWNEWTTKEDQKRQSVSIVAEEVFLLSPKNQASSDSGEVAPPPDDIDF